MKAHKVVRCHSSHIFLYSRLIDVGEVVSLMHWLPFTSRKIFVIFSVRGCVSPRAVMCLEGLGHLKNAVASGIEPSAFYLSASTN
jgi:hypothetical protein